MRAIDRLRDITHSFPLTLDLGCHTGQFQSLVKDAGGIHHLVQCDSAINMLNGVDGLTLCADEERLPFAENSFDAVISTLSLHHVNDLVGCFIQIQKILKPDGLFLAIMPGPATLKELRESYTVADIATTDGLSPHVSPFMDVRDAGNLLQRAGFALPVIDNEELIITYETPERLLTELRGMGETNCLIEQQKGLVRPEHLASMYLHYVSEHTFAEESHDAAPRVHATVEFVTLTAWKPGPNQQQPSARGSGTINLGEALS